MEVRFVPTSVAAKRFGVKPTTITWMIRTGKLKAEQHGDRGWYRIPETELPPQTDRISVMESRLKTLELWRERMELSMRRG